MQLTPQFIREQLHQERVVTRNVEYVCEHIESWWKNHDLCLSNHALKLQLISLLSLTLRGDDRYYFDNVGKHGISAVCFTGIFHTDDYYLALITHEALCELFHLRDIKYPYENHKALFLKPGAETRGVSRLTCPRPPPPPLRYPGYWHQSPGHGCAGGSTPKPSDARSPSPWGCPSYRT